jgi:hypothetical protein
MSPSVTDVRTMAAPGSTALTAVSAALGSGSQMTLLGTTGLHNRLRGRLIESLILAIVVRC